MTSPNKKRRTTTEKLSHEPLPDDLLVSCLARVSRLYYPTLSLVSKHFRSLLTSPELYQTRSQLGRTENCLYVCLRFSPTDPNRRWFMLCRRPNQALTNDTRKTKKKSGGYALAPISIPNIPQTPSESESESVVAVGSNIYTIGSSMYKSPLSSVSILDCRTHTWREGPSMRVERYWSNANVFNGKIYVAGGCDQVNASNWMEVFDPKTQVWEPVLNPLAERCGSRIFKGAVIEAEICMFGDRGVVYKPNEDRWEMITELTYLNLGWDLHSYCVIENVLYSHNCSDGFEWYDSKIRHWVKLKGLKGHPRFGGDNYVKIVDYGGKMAVLWKSRENKMIWCAVIALQRCKNENIWGKLEWCDVVLDVPNAFEVVSAISATL